MHQHHRGAVVACLLEEIARLLGFSSAFHVYRRVNALLARLRRSLEAQGIESAVP